MEWPTLYVRYPTSHSQSLSTSLLKYRQVHAYLLDSHAVIPIWSATRTSWQHPKTTITQKEDPWQARVDIKKKKKKNEQTLMGTGNRRRKNSKGPGVGLGLNTEHWKEKARRKKKNTHTHTQKSYVLYSVFLKILGP